MKHCKHAGAFAVTAAAFILAISCASQPKVAAPEAQPAAAPQPAPQVQASPQTTVAAPDADRQKATDLRKKAFDLGIKDVLPDDYAVAEAAYAKGNDAYGKDNASAAAAYQDAAAKFSAAIDKGLPLIAAKEKARAQQLRDAALKNGANTAYAPQWSNAESGLASADKANGAADYTNAISGYRNASMDYATLYTLGQAGSVRSFITAHDLAKWASSPWTIAEAKYQASQDVFGKDRKASSDSADEAKLRYGIAKDTALEYYSGDRKKASENERDHASTIKAQVAVKDEYQAAQALYDKAQAAESAKDYENSSDLYDKAAKAFSSAYAHAKAKMDTAKGEMDSLDAAIATRQASGASR